MGINTQKYYEIEGLVSDLDGTIMLFPENKKSAWGFLNKKLGLEKKDAALYACFPTRRV